MQRHVSADYMEKARKRAGGSIKLKNPDQGAATSVLLASSPLLEGTGGRYFEDCNEVETIDKRPANTYGGVARYALDPANVERLRDVSLEMIA